MTSSGLTADRLREIMSYDPETGIMVRRLAVKRGPVGSAVGTVNSCGYLICRIHYRIYYVHRLAWLYMTGEWPAEYIDHINYNRSDNRWANLRQASKAQNVWNKRKMARNKSGATGVYWFKQYGRWKASIVVNGRECFLGYFDDKSKAIVARAAAELRHFGDFAPPPGT